MNDRPTPAARLPGGIHRRSFLRASAGAGVTAAILPGTVASAVNGAGEERWHYVAPRQITSSPTVVDGTVYVGSHAHVEGDDSVHALDVATGEKEWGMASTKPVGSSPTVVDGIVRREP